MENGKIKRVLVELENGEVVEFDKQVVLFAEVEMTELEKKLHSSSTKSCSIANCRGQFLAHAADNLLNSIRHQAPGLDRAIIIRHILKQTDSLTEMLEEFDELND